MIPDLGILLVFAVFVLWKAKPQQAAADDAYIKRLNLLRGVFAIEIIVGHVVRDNATVLSVLGKMMMISVAYYFFVSAYGLASSFDRKSGYLKSFPKQKLLYLVLLAASAYAVSCLIEAVSGSFHHYIPESLVKLPSTFVTSMNWYIWVQLMWYLLFMVIYGGIGRRWRVPTACLVGMVLGSIFFFQGMEQKYYCSLMGFPAGLCFYEYRSEILTFMKKWYGKALILLAAGAGALCLKLPENSYLGMMLLRNLLCVSSILLLLYLLKYVKLQNPVTDYFGKISAELYLMQFPWLYLTEPMQEQYPLRMVLVLAATVASAAVLHRFNELWRRKLKSVSA